MPFNDDTMPFNDDTMPTQLNKGKKLFTCRNNEARIANIMTFLMASSKHL